MTGNIRPARNADAASIARIGTQLGYDVDTPETAERIGRVLSRSDQQIFVAELDDQVVGWVHAMIFDLIESEPFVVIGGLVVDSNHRRLGIARNLMARAEDWTRERGLSIVRLSSSSTRTAAHTFYKTIGYEHIKTQYAFAKSLDGAGRQTLEQFVARVEEADSQ
jgi:ribosomal protein S18 acetylase RimI-like enzyme